MNIVNKIISTTSGAAIGYTVSLVFALKYAKESKPVPEIVIIPTIVGGVIGFAIS